MTGHVVSHPYQDLYSWVCKGKEFLHGTSNFEIRDKNELAFATGKGKMQGFNPGVFVTWNWGEVGM